MGTRMAAFLALTVMTSLLLVSPLNNTIRGQPGEGGTLAPSLAPADAIDDPTSVLNTGPPTFIDLDADGVDDRVEQFLAEKFAPVTLIEPDESNYPVNVDWILQRASLEYDEECTVDHLHTYTEAYLSTIGDQAHLIGDQASLTGGFPPSPWRNSGLDCEAVVD